MNPLNPDKHPDVCSRYSCDEGMSWSDFTFASSNIVLWAVHTKPGETTTQVLSVTT